MGTHGAGVQIEGTAFRLADILVKSKIPGVRQMSLIKNIVRIGMPDGDFVIKIIDRPEQRTTQLDIQVTFRGSKEDGGTWRAQWYVDIPQPSAISKIGSVLIDEVAKSRRHFAGLLEDAAAAASGAIPSIASLSGYDIKRHEEPTVG